MDTIAVPIHSSVHHMLPSAHGGAVGAGTSGVGTRTWTRKGQPPAMATLPVLRPAPGRGAAAPTTASSDAPDDPPPLPPPPPAGAADTGSEDAAAVGAVAMLLTPRELRIGLEMVEKLGQLCFQTLKWWGGLVLPVRHLRQLA